MKCYGTNRCSHPLICKTMGCAAGEVYYRDRRVTCPKCNGDGAFESEPSGAYLSTRKIRCTFCGGRGFICDDEE
jgi:hypothetical protein